MKTCTGIFDDNDIGDPIARSDQQIEIAVVVQVMQNSTLHRHTIEILLAEFLWWDTHAQHANILVSLDNLLSRKKGASVLASWSHHNPGREHLDLEFFERAEEMGFEMSPLRTETKGYSDIGDKEMQPCYLVRMTRRGSPTLHRNE